MRFQHPFLVPHQTGTVPCAAGILPARSCSMGGRLPVCPSPTGRGWREVTGEGVFSTSPNGWDAPCGQAPSPDRGRICIVSGKCTLHHHPQKSGIIRHLFSMRSGAPTWPWLFHRISPRSAPNSKGNVAGAHSGALCVLQIPVQCSGARDWPY